MRLSRSIGDAVDLDDSAHGTVLWAWPHRTVHRLTFIAVMSQRLALLSPEVAADNDGTGTYLVSFAIQATTHPALIPQEVAGHRRRHPRIPAAEGSKAPARAGNPRRSRVFMQRS
jgi:hypothetical protein